MTGLSFIFKYYKYSISLFSCEIYNLLIIVIILLLLLLLFPVNVDRGCT